MRKHLKHLFALVVGFVIRYQPTTAAEGNSSEQGGVTKKPLMAAWIEKPLYATSPNNGSLLENEAHGMIRDALARHMTVECGWHSGVEYQMQTLRVDSEFGMIELLRQNKAHIAFPTFEYPATRRYPEFPFFKLHDYPGTEYITTKGNTSALRVVLDTVLKAWPLVAVTLVHTAIAGVIMWALVSVSWLCKT